MDIVAVFLTFFFLKITNVNILKPTQKEGSALAICQKERVYAKVSDDDSKIDPKYAVLIRLF